MTARGTPLPTELDSPQPNAAQGALVFWNPNSGRAEQALAIGQQLRARSDVTVVEPDSNDQLHQRLKEAVAGGCQLAIAAGGDGTVNTLVNALMRLEARDRPAMAVLPIGTANDFAYTLQLPDDLETAHEWLFRGPYTPMDVICVETARGSTQHFVNVAAGGNSVRVTSELTDELKQKWGALCYLRGAIGVLSDLTAYHTRLAFDDGLEETFDVWSLLVANGRSNAGRMLVAPEAKPHDGLMDVIVVRDGDLIDLASVATSFALGNYLESEQVVYRQVRRLTIESAPPMQFSLDGEVLQDVPVRFELLPSAIRMRAGDGFAEHI